MKKRPRKRTTLNARLSVLSTPIFLLDNRRRVIFFNDGCAELTGWSADEVLGQACDYASDAEDGIAVLIGSLCPPAEVFSGKPASVPAHLVHRDGRPIPRVLNFFPLFGGEGRVEGVLGLVTEIPPPKRAVETTPAQRLHADLAALRAALRQRFGLRSFVARGAAMQRVLEQIQLARATKVGVTLEGERGTGKEHIARLIHYESADRARPLVPIDCRAVSAIDLKLTLRRLLEGDEDDRPGRAVPMLNPGAVYLANVDRMPSDVQEYLVELYRRTPDRRPDVRLLAGTTANLDEALAREELRPEFFYLITPIRIELRPLRHRPDDLPLLAQHFLESSNRGAERQIGGFAEETWTLFRRYNWPGNLDELAAVIGEAHTAAAGDLIQARDLPFRFRTGMDAQTVGPVIEPKVEPLEPLLERIEREQIERALVQARHNRSRAAELLGLTRPRLYRRMEALGIADLETDGPAGAG